MALVATAWRLYLAPITFFSELKIVEKKKFLIGIKHEEKQVPPMVFIYFSRFGGFGGWGGGGGDKNKKKKKKTHI